MIKNRWYPLTVMTVLISLVVSACLSPYTVAKTQTIAFAPVITGGVITAQTIVKAISIYIGVCGIKLPKDCGDQYGTAYKKIQRELQLSAEQMKNIIKEIVKRFEKSEKPTTTTQAPQNLIKKPLPKPVPVTGSEFFTSTRTTEKEDPICSGKVWYGFTRFGTHLMKEKFKLIKTDTKASGLTVCVSQFSQNQNFLAEQVSRVYYHQVLPFLRKTTQRSTKKMVTIYVSRWALGEVAYENNILLPDQNINHRDSTAGLIHEMLHVLVYQHEMVMDNAIEEGVATYIECEFLHQKPCHNHDPHIHNKLKEMKILQKKILFPSINNWILSKELTLFQAGYYYMEQFIRYVVNQVRMRKNRNKDRYDPLQEMLHSKNVDSWIWDIAVAKYAQSAYLPFIEQFENRLFAKHFP